MKFSYRQIFLEVPVLCRNEHNLLTCFYKIRDARVISTIAMNARSPGPHSKFDWKRLISLRKQRTGAHDGQSSAPCAMCRAINIEWGPGVYENFASSSWNYFYLKICLRSIWKSFFEIKASTSKFFMIFLNFRNFFKLSGGKNDYGAMTIDD